LLLFLHAAAGHIETKKDRGKRGYEACALVEPSARLFLGRPFSAKILPLPFCRKRIRLQPM
jgi:hypothetical protein